MNRVATFAILSYVSMTSAVMAAGEAHGEEAKGGLPQFEPTWFASQIFWLAIAFAILYIFFAKKTLPDISSVIENRKNHIQSDLETAEKLATKADQVQDAYQADLVKAQDKAAKAISKVENDMKAEAEKAAEAFRLRSEKEMKKAEDNIAKAQNAAMADMNSIAAEAASEAVAKIIGGKADKDKAMSIIEGLSGKAKAA